MNLSAKPRFSLAWLVAYISMICVVAGSVIYFRAQLLSVYGTPAAQHDWNEWRDDAKKRATGAGPVKQRVPKSAEPPALVLMRDYFAACLGLALLLSSVLFATFMFFLRGVLSGRGGFVDRSPKENT